MVFNLPYMRAINNKLPNSKSNWKNDYPLHTNEEYKIIAALMQEVQGIGILCPSVWSRLIIQFLLE